MMMGPADLSMRPGTGASWFLPRPFTKHGPRQRFSTTISFTTTILDNDLLHDTIHDNDMHDSRQERLNDTTADNA